MNNWAVIRTGGKQYMVFEGQSIDIEKLRGKDGDIVSFEEVLLVSNSGSIKIGKPLVEKVKVKAEIISSFKGKKIRVVKFKSKSRYLRTTGHRQQKTRVHIEKIES
ncbi:MAG: 50S ribosomal protein L21 [Candidatus Curtissbacteria bacterium GW2011_GWA1_40_9]|uniref:Large ribosomal subunit protein bL21 n=1 Tax=Candidatus Curtissbacteria bacterium GW2011_GWA1_40_9 TaxID=1618408 RepID=A0A0G0WS06_9BACT|nr:MAG: 50S ribosomal protein L21 [Candidatus Curtissbacteria bacterium GW2011_GWA1_40_9]